MANTTSEKDVELWMNFSLVMINVPATMLNSIMITVYISNRKVGHVILISYVYYTLFLLLRCEVPVVHMNARVF